MSKWRKGTGAAAFGIAVGLIPTIGHGQEIDILMALPAATLTFSAAFIAARSCCSAENEAGATRRSGWATMLTGQLERLNANA